MRGIIRYFRRNSLLSVVVAVLVTSCIFLYLSDTSSQSIVTKEEIDDKSIQLEKQAAQLIADENKMSQLQQEVARLEAELKFEKLRGEMLDRQVEAANKAPPPVTTPAAKTAADMFRREQERRQANILDACSAPDRPKGIVHSLLPTPGGMTYCIIPRAANTFWHQIYRYINNDYIQENVRSPLDITWKEAKERAYRRTKKVTWTRLSDKDKDGILKSKVFFAVQNPFKRLWETYVDNFRLPRKWSSTGIKIESRRKTKPAPIKDFRSMVSPCGMEVSFQEYVTFSLKSYEMDYDPFYRLCDPCQLKPSFVIQEETRREDTRFVLQHFNLAWVATGSTRNLSQAEALRYINNTVADTLPLFKSATNLFYIAENNGLDRAAQKKNFLVQAYQGIGRDSLEAVKRKYDFDFKLFQYERDPLEFNAGRPRQ